MEAPRIEINPHPSMRYGIVVTVADAPGPFDVIQASAEYEVSNRDCVPEQQISGATILPNKRVELSLRLTGENTYESDLYADLIKDENYFSKGVCHWSLVAVSAKASQGAMNFIASLFTPEFFSSEGVTRYYSYASYRDRATRMLNTGNVSRSAYPDPSSTFSIHVAAREIRQ